ncbi:VCBS repeat-containing protein [Rubripirellula amarantea]|nr:VCBS repeat-containing protein [Rubripirellula amarantea]
MPICAQEPQAGSQESHADGSSGPKDTCKPCSFEIKLLALDSNEGIAAGDVDGDGITDLVAGRSWFRGGDWAPRPLRLIEDWNGYVESNGDYVMDVNQDGRLDVIAGSFMGSEVHWFENPGDEGLRLGQLWPKHVLVDTERKTNEGQLLEDVDGDGRPEWIVNSWTKDVPMMVWRLEPIESGEAKSDGGASDGSSSGASAKISQADASKPAAYKMVGHELGPKGNGHGLAVGDISGDGRYDVLVGQGWYEQPASQPWTQPWAFHPDWDLHSSLPMLVVDLDEDGDHDLVIGNGHDYGLYWWQNDGADETGKISWTEHEIDSSFSQPHSLAWADIDGDQRPDLIAGKRYFAHNGNDPGGMDMPCLYYYQWDPSTKKFTRYTIDEGHVGVGLQIVTEDFNGDGRADIAVAGKSGTYLIRSR